MFPAWTPSEVDSERAASRICSLSKTGASRGEGSMGAGMAGDGSRRVLGSVEAVTALCRRVERPENGQVT